MTQEKLYFYEESFIPQYKFDEWSRTFKGMYEISTYGDAVEHSDIQAYSTIEGVMLSNVIDFLEIIHIDDDTYVSQSLYDFFRRIGIANNESTMLDFLHNQNEIKHLAYDDDQNIDENSIILTKITNDRIYLDACRFIEVYF